MRLNTVRMLRDWLASEDNGVNAFVQTLELDAGDVGPDTITIYDETSDGWVARRRASAEHSGITYPALAVFVPAESILDGEVHVEVRDGSIPVCIAYLEANTSSSSEGNADALYTMRAVRRSLAALEADASIPQRQRNSIQLVSCTDMREPPVLQQWDDAVLMAALLTTWEVRDIAPRTPAA